MFSIFVDNTFNYETFVTGIFCHYGLAPCYSDDLRTLIFGGTSGILHFLGNRKLEQRLS